eukprot:scaffold203704_cov50-Prasinocladus_malaysianus.AAC.1
MTLARKLQQPKNHFSALNAFELTITWKLRADLDHRPLPSAVREKGRSCRTKTVVIEWFYEYS